MGQTETARGVLGREGSVRAREPSQKRRQRIGIALEERIGKSKRQRDAKRVAIAARVFGGDEALTVRDPHLEHAPLAGKRRDPIGRRRGIGGAR